MLNIVTGKYVRKEEKELVKNNLLIPQAYLVLSNFRDVMRDREIYVRVDFEQEYGEEPFYLIKLVLKFNNIPNKGHEILVEATGTDLLEVIEKFNLLLFTSRARKYIVGRMDGKPYTPYPIVTKSTPIEDLLKEVEQIYYKTLQ